MLVGRCNLAVLPTPEVQLQVPHTSQLWAYESVSDKMCVLSFPCMIFRLEVIIPKREVRGKEDWIPPLS